MGSLFEWITDWIKEGLIEAITGQYTSIFNSVNNQVADVANQVGQTPQGWNGGVFSMIQNLSETVVIPIAGIILTFVLVYELIQMILEKNNMHDFDTFNIFKWIFKTFVATYLLTNCFTIVMAVFDVAQNVVSNSAGIINGSLDVSAALSDLETQLEAMGMWELIGLWLETNIIINSRQHSIPHISMCHKLFFRTFVAVQDRLTLWRRRGIVPVLSAATG